MRLHLESKDGNTYVRNRFGNSVITGESREDCYAAAVELARLAVEDYSSAAIIFFTNDKVQAFHNFALDHDHCSDERVAGESILLEIAVYLKEFNMRLSALDQTASFVLDSRPIHIFIDQDVLDFAECTTLETLYQHLCSDAKRVEMYFHVMNASKEVGRICNSYVKVSYDELGYSLTFKSCVEEDCVYRF